jgi:hypothetical protein
LDELIRHHLDNVCKEIDKRNCVFVKDLSALRDYNARLIDERDGWRNAMQHLTPLGSEYTTADECKRYIEGKMGRDIPKRIVDAERERDELIGKLDRTCERENELRLDLQDALNKLDALKAEYDAGVAEFNAGFAANAPEHTPDAERYFDTAPAYRAALEKIERVWVGESVVDEHIAAIKMYTISAYALNNADVE